MKRFTLLWIALICFPLLIKAQDLKVLERLDADRITTGNTLYIWKDGKTLRYYKTSTNGDDENELNESDIIGLTVSNKMINLKMAFYNPLQYKVKVSSTYLDDPFTKSYDQFLEAFSAAFGEIIQPTETLSQVQPISKATPAILLAISENTRKEKEKPLTKTQVQSTYKYYAKIGENFVGFTEKPIVKTVLLKDWYYQLLKQAGDKEELNKALAKYSQQLESVLYYKVKVGFEEKSLDDWIKEETTKLYNINDCNSFKDEIKLAKSLKDTLVKRVDQANSAHASLIELINAPTGVTTDLSFDAYSQNTIADLELKVSPLLESRKTKLDEFITFVNKLDADFSNQYTVGSSELLGRKFGNLGNIPMKSNQDVNISITFTKINIDGEEIPDDVTHVTFTAIKYTKGVFNFSTGFVLTNLSFPNYSVATDASGAMTIQRELPTRKRVLPTVFLNFYSKLPFSNLYLILPQLGVSTGKEYPSILLGGGLAIGNRFSFTGGAIMAFAKDLNNYGVGDRIVRESDLENDLTYKYNFKGYLSISYRLGKN